MSLGSPAMTPISRTLSSHGTGRYAQVDSTLLRVPIAGKLSFVHFTGLWSLSPPTGLCFADVLMTFRLLFPSGLRNLFILVFIVCAPPF